jgi:hypothetical protein
MKTKSFHCIILFVVMIGFSVLFTQKVRCGEFVVLNQTFTYGIDDNAFSLAALDFSGMPTNWMSPDDYYNGTFYAYYEVLSVPTSVPFGIQLGVFQYEPSKAGWDGQNFYESCSYEHAQLAGVGSIATFTSSPSAWWTWHGGVDFSKVYDFQSVGPIIWGTSPDGILSPSPGGNDATYAVRANWFPLTLKVIIVAVSSGTNFSGWDTYLMPCTPAQQSAPTYGIDYYNEKTNKIVPPTDEYSYNSDMSGAVNGTGSKLTLVPGQTVYFRSKDAGTCLLASDIQTLVVPPRPSTPSYTIDYAAEKTVENVPASIAYTPDFVSFYSGTGVPVAVIPGAELYFYVNATSSSFYSNVFHLVMPSRPPAPSSITIDFINEKTNEAISSDMEYSTLVSFITSTTGTGDPVTVTPGQDLYIRYKATASAFASPAFLLNVPLRPDAPVATVNYEQEKTVESFSSSVEYSTSASMTGAVSCSDTTIELTPGTDLYVRQKSTASSFASDITHLSVPERPATPSITIDFINEVTSYIPSTMAWSTDPSGSSPVSGTNAPVTVMPGTNLYIWVSATAGSFCSAIQTLDVPDRPAAPSGITIDFINERTNQNITSGMEYSASASFTGSVSGTGNPVAVIPGQDLYIRIKATTSAFVSSAFLLNVPERPASPSFTIDFVNEKTSESVGSEIEYSVNEDFMTALSGSGSPVSLDPGNNLYFRTKSTSSSFCSLGFLLEVPNRPVLEYTGEDTITSPLFTVQAILDESMTGFDLSDLSVTNGQAQNLRGDNLFDIIPIAKGDVEVSVLPNSFDNGGFASNQIVVYYNKGGTGFADPELNEIMVYPVPSKNGLVSIVINRQGQTRIELLSSTGIMIREFVLKDATIETLNLEAFKGLYYLRISTGDTQKIKKIVLY